jgi:hypothetical protein
MPLIDEITDEYYRQYPHRVGNGISYPDWLPALLAVLEKRLEDKQDKAKPEYRIY